MKKIFILFVMLFVAHTLFSQVLYKEGVVKGKHVTYEVSRGKKPLEAFTYIRNMNNPDTTFCEVPRRDKFPPQLVDIQCQVVEIIHDYLSPEEIDRMEPGWGPIVTFRLDAKTNKVLQITNFSYFGEEPFWLNLDPDRLYELEQIILNKLELPTNLQETYFESDFSILISSDQIQNIKETRKRRKAAIKEWKQNDIEVKVLPGPKYILEDESNEEKKEQKKEQGETYLRCFK